MYLIRWNGLSGENYRNIITSDGEGYYLYFEGLLGETVLNKQVANDYFLVSTPDGSVVNKYFVGVALLQSPFILAVYSYKALMGQEINLYSEAFQKTVSFAGIFYLFIGLWASRKFLIDFNIEQRIIAFGLIALFFGTNLSYYSLLEPAMSHVYSFALITLFLLLYRKLFINFEQNKVIILAFVFGLIVLVRPFNGLIVLALPLISLDNRNLLDTLKRVFISFPSNLISIIIFGSLLSIQLVFWKLQTGNFLLWSYAKEGFYFLHPEWVNFLFSFRKGLFIYTPFVLLSILLFSLTIRKQTRLLISGLGFFVTLVYFLSSWWNWYYGDSYGSRVMVDYMVIFILFFALGLQQIQYKFQKYVVLLATLFVILNVFQTYQYYYRIISPFDMNAEKYAFTFGKAGSQNQGLLGGRDDMVCYHTKPLIPVFYDKVDFIKPNNKFLYLTTPIFTENGKTWLSFTPSDEFGLSFKFSATLFEDYSSAHVELSNRTKYFSGNLNRVFWTVTYFDSNYNVYYHREYKINGIPLKVNQVRKDDYSFALVKPESSDDIVQIAIWNYTHSTFLLTDLEIDVKGIVE